MCRCKFVPSSDYNSTYTMIQRDEVVGVYGFIFFRDTNWVTVIIDESVRFYSDKILLADPTTACYSPPFPNLRNSVMRRSSYTITTSQNTTSLLEKAARVYILPSPVRRVKHGYLSLRRPTRSSMEATLRCLEGKPVKLLKISLGAFTSSTHLLK